MIKQDYKSGRVQVEGRTFEIEFWTETHFGLPYLCPHDFHWIQTDTDGTKIFRCSVCGKKEQTKGDYP